MKASMAEQHTPTTLAERISELSHQHGSLRAAARVLDCDAGYLSRLAAGAKSAPSVALLRRMGLRQVVSYERIHRAALQTTGGGKP